MDGVVAVNHQMKPYSQILNTNRFHQKMKEYISNEINTVLQQYHNIDHLRIQEELPDDLHQSQMVSSHMHTVIERFYTHQHQLEDWFYTLERSLQQPTLRGQVPEPNLGFDGLRINRSAICCDFLKPALVKKLLDTAKDSAVRQVLPEKKKFTTADVLSFYFEHYMREEMYDFKLECARKLKKIHREILERPPLNTIPLDLLDALDYEFMYHATRKWVDDNDFGVDVDVPLNTCSSSHAPPSNPTKKLRGFDDLDGWELDF